jgi:hypothetical protein
VNTNISAQFGDSITLQSVHLTATNIQAGDALGITLIWQTDKPITTRYKVFIHLLNSAGQLVTQHDGEPGNNLKLTTTWLPNTPITDPYGLLIPADVLPGDYTLIVGLYDINNPQNRLLVNQGADGDHVTLGTIHVTP